MNEVMQIITDGFWRLYDWCRKNVITSLAIAAIIVMVGIMLSFISCSPRALHKGEDPVQGITWKYCVDGTLRFEGEGEIVGAVTEYVSGSQITDTPQWYEFRHEVTAIEIGEDITYVGMDSFVDFDILTELIVRGETTGLDMECIRYTTDEGWEVYRGVTVYGMEESTARSYADSCGLEYRPL